MKIKFLLIATTYAITVLKNFTLIHTGTMFIKAKATTKLGVLLSPFLLTFEKIANWTIENSEYIVWVLGAVIIDHLLGTIKHLWFTRTFSMKKNVTGMMVKLALVVAGGFLFEGLNQLIDPNAGKMAEYTKDYLTITTRIIVFLYPAGSAFSNMSIISGGKFPPVGWMERLKKFQTNLDPSGFQGPKPPIT